MTRHHIIDGEQVPFTQEEEAAQDIIDNAHPLLSAKASKITELGLAYTSSLAADVEFTTAGAITATFDVSEMVIKDLQNAIAGFGDTGVVPVGFYWVAKDNSQPAFTYADIQGLARAITDRGWAGFKNLQDKKQLVRDAADVPAINTVNW